MDQNSPRPSSFPEPNDVKAAHHDGSHLPPEAGSANSSGKFNIRDSVEEVLSHYNNVLAGLEDARGISTGFRDLDQLIGGLRPGEMFVIAARPGMGKTSLMLSIAEHICIDQKVPTLIFSGESTAFQRVQRLLFSRAKYVANRLFHQNITPTKPDLLRLKQAASEIANSMLFMEELSGSTMEKLRATAIRHKRENNIGFIAIDPIHMIRSDSPQAGQSREREVTEISSGIKSLAKELGVPILVLARLNRGPEFRCGRLLGIPRMSDLGDSGPIENDADMVGLLYRPNYYAETAEEKEAEAGRAELILAKNRNGDTGWTPLTFIADLMRFEPASDLADSAAQVSGRDEPREAWDDYHQNRVENRVR